MKLNHFRLTRENITNVDGHSHSMSRCVIRSRGGTAQEWERFKILAVRDKIKFIHYSVSLMALLLRNYGVQQQALTEHPHFFEDANLPYAAYLKCLQSIQRRTRDPQILTGLELNIVSNSDKTSHIDISSKICGVTIDDILQHQQVIVASVHQKFIQSIIPGINRDRYFKLLCSAVQQLGEIGNRYKKQIPLVLGHPFSAASEINRKAFDHETLADNWSQPRPTPEFYRFQRSRDAPIPYFSESQLWHLAECMFKARVFPELNRLYLMRGHTEIPLTEYKEGSRRPLTIIGVYIDYCKKHDKKNPPIVSMGSDDHNYRLVGKLPSPLHYEKLLSHIPQLVDAHMWRIPTP